MNFLKHLVLYMLTGLRKSIGFSDLTNKILSIMGELRERPDKTLKLNSEDNERGRKSFNDGKYCYGFLSDNFLIGAQLNAVVYQSDKVDRVGVEPTTSAVAAFLDYSFTSI